MRGAGEDSTDVPARIRRRTARPLRALWPFLRPYRGLLGAAVVALVITAGISLILPIAVRRVVDGFQKGGGLLDYYFEAALFIAAALALGTGARYWLVTRFGERVVADIRKAAANRDLSKTGSQVRLR